MLMVSLFFVVFLWLIDTSVCYQNSRNVEKINVVKTGLSSLNLFKFTSSIFSKDTFNVVNLEVTTNSDKESVNSANSLVEATVIVSGMVQGPFYRTIVKNEANFQRKIFGTLFENNDGTTSITVQGEKKKIESFVRWVKKGPGLSQIVNVNSVEYKNITELTFDAQFIEKQVLNK